MNSLYDKGRQAFLDGGISWTGDNIKLILVDTDDYTVNLATDQFLSDIPGIAIVATSTNLSAKTSTAGVADANDVTFTSVTGDEVEALVLYQDTGVAATSQLIGYIDTATGLPVVPSSGDILVIWDDGSSKIYKL